VKIVKVMKNIRVANTLKNRETRDHIDHNQRNPYKRQAYSNDRGQFNATFTLCGFSKEVTLASVRLGLVLSNLLILFAACVSYFAWLDAKYNWQLSNVARPGRNILRAMENMPPLPNQDQDIISGVHCYLDQMLYMTAFNLFIYWTIYGVIISCRFGGTCDICTIVVSVPHTLIMIMWEVGVAVAVLRVSMILEHLPWENLKFTNMKHYRDLKYVEEFYTTWGPWISSSYILCVPVQMLLMTLPFLITNLPFQAADEESQINSRKQAVSVSAVSKSVASVHFAVRRQAGSFNRSVAAKANSLNTSVTSNTNRLTRLFRRVFCDNSARLSDASDEFVVKCIDVSHESEYIGLGDLHPKITEHNLSDDSEYVGLGDLHHGINEHNASKQKDNEEVASLYHCEMPHEKIEKVKTQKLFTRVRRVSWRGQSAGKAVIDTMNRVYHVHSSSRPLWTLLDEKETPHPRLVENDVLAGGVSIYSSPIDSEYVDMYRGSPPPPYRLHDPNRQPQRMEVGASSIGLAPLYSTLI